jgi:hypothetical protein
MCAAEISKSSILGFRAQYPGNVEKIIRPRFWGVSDYRGSWFTAAMKATCLVKHLVIQKARTSVILWIHQSSRAEALHLWYLQDIDF